MLTPALVLSLLACATAHTPGLGERPADLPPPSCIPPGGFPGSFKEQSLLEAINNIRTGQAGNILVCSFPSMQTAEPSMTIDSKQAVSITGNFASGKAGPRLWAQFNVQGDLFLTALTIQDQAEAIQVSSDGGLVARSVSFLRLKIGPAGNGAAANINGGAAWFYDCLFDSNEVDQPHVPPGGKYGLSGGALFFDTGLGVIVDSVLSNNRADCNGGGIWAHRSSIFITTTQFTGNHVDGCEGAWPDGGDNIYVWPGPQGGTVPCSAPGHALNGACLIDGNFTNMSYVVSPQ